MRNIFPIEKIKQQIDYLLNNPEKIKPFSIEDMEVKFETVQTKTPRQWAEDYLNSEEGKLEVKKWEKEFLEYMVLGTPTVHLNKDLLDEMGYYLNVKELSTEKILEIYGDTLTEEEKNEVLKRTI